MRRFFSVAYGIAWRNVRAAIANPTLLIPPIVAPLVFFATFAGGMSALQNNPNFSFPSGYTSFQFVFILMQAAVFNGVFLSFATARDFDTGFTRRLLLAAPNRSGLIAGYVAAALIRTSVAFVVLFTVGLAVGMRVDGSIIDVFSLVALALSLTVIGVLWGTGIAMRFRTMQSAPLMQVPVFLGLFLAPVFVPVALLAGWIKGAAEVNPITVFLEAGRGYISGTGAEALRAFGVAAVMIAVLTLWAVLGLRRAEKAG
jgi:ABC-2 type transport system permease protein